VPTDVGIALQEFASSLGPLEAESSGIILEIPVVSSLYGVDGLPSVFDVASVTINAGLELTGLSTPKYQRIDGFTGYASIDIDFGTDVALFGFFVSYSCRTTRGVSVLYSVDGTNYFPIPDVPSVGLFNIEYDYLTGWSPRSSADDRRYIEPFGLETDLLGSLENPFMALLSGDRMFGLGGTRLTLPLQWTPIFDWPDYRPQAWFKGPNGTIQARYWQIQLEVQRTGSTSPYLLHDIKVA
jgi:hypothetical protein